MKTILRLTFVAALGFAGCSDIASVDRTEVEGDTVFVPTPGSGATGGASGTGGSTGGGTGGATGGAGGAGGATGGAGGGAAGAGGTATSAR